MIASDVHHDNQQMMMKPNEVNLGIKEEEFSDDEGNSKVKKTKKVKKEATTTGKNSKADKKTASKTEKKRTRDADEGEEEGGSKSKKAKKPSAYTISEKLATLLGLERNDTRYQVNNLYGMYYVFYTVYSNIPK